MTTALVIGYGSIGARHARVLASLGVDVRVVSKRGDVPFSCVSSLDAAQAADIVVIANETALHYRTLCAVAAQRLGAKILIEKPLFHDDLPLPSGLPAFTRVGYVLRFHPLMQRLFEALRGQEFFTVHAYVGQHLEDWRPGTDHKASYSARAHEGGALRDLSHELDLIDVIAGPWRALTALVGSRSGLGIASDTAATLLLRTDRCAHVAVHMNLLDRPAHRVLTVNAARGTASIDLVRNRAEIFGDVTEVTVDRDAAFRAMHEAVLRGDDATLCDVTAARRTLSAIAAAERATTSDTWVKS